MQALKRVLAPAHAGIRARVVNRALLLENERACIRVASLARHVSVHFPDPALLAGVRARHPELRCGPQSCCVRDDQHLPLYELQRAALRVFLGASEEGCAMLRPARAFPWT
jgi:hypothetical protein